MNRKLTSFLIALLFLCVGYIVYISLNVSKINTQINQLRERNEDLDKQNEVLQSLYLNLTHEKKILLLQIQSLKGEVFVLTTNVSNKEKELKDIKGRYSKLSDNELVKSLIEAYEADSIRTATKH